MTGHLRDKLLFGLLALLVLGAAACSGGETEPAATPDEAVTRVACGLADNRPEVVWHALPASYQEDVTELVHEAAATMDPELWNRSFGVLQKLSQLLSDKQDLILEHPMIAQGMAGKDDVEDSFDAVVELFDTVVRSDLADLDDVKKLDIEKFLAKTGRDLMEQMAEASALAPDDQWARQMTLLRATEATVLSSSGDTATLRIERPGQAAREEQYVRVEGKWIPKELADSWSSQIADARQKLARVSGQESPEDKQKTLMMLSMVEGALDSMLAADSPEQFNAAIGSAMGMAMGAVMAQSGNGGMLSPSGSLLPRSQPSPQPAPAPVAEARPSPRKEIELALPMVEIAEDGTIPVAQADHFVGRTMWVTSTTGLDSKCRLTGVENDQLMFERQFTTGSISFELSPSEIESLRVIDQ